MSIQNLSKTNPAQLNDAPLNKEFTLKDGDRFTISDRSFVYRAPERKSKVSFPRTARERERERERGGGRRDRERFCIALQASLEAVGVEEVISKYTYIFIPTLKSHDILFLVIKH